MSYDLYLELFDPWVVEECDQEMLTDPGPVDRQISWPDLAPADPQTLAAAEAG